MKTLLFIFFSVCLSSCSSSRLIFNQRDPANFEANHLKEIQVEHEIRLLEEMKGSHWSWPQFYGKHYSSMALIIARINGLRVSWDTIAFSQALIKDQLADGSWPRNIDIATVVGDLDATILNYWALRVIGLPIDNPRMLKAKQFIQSNGGLNASTPLLRHLLAVTGMVDWKKLPPMSSALFKEWPHGIGGKFAIWNKLYFQSFYVLQKLKPKLGPTSLFMGELSTVSPSNSVKKLKSIPKDILALLNELSRNQSASGFWDGHAQGSLLLTLCFQSILDQGPIFESTWSESSRRVFAKLEALEAEARIPYSGTMMEGELWDTAYALQALSKENFPKVKIIEAVDWLLSKQNENGSFSYSIDFKSNPDVDTTAEVVKSLLNVKSYWQVRETEIQLATERALKWIADRQNSDGGFAAWSVGQKNKSALALAVDLLLRAQKVSKGVREGLYDVSLPHITAHVIEAIILAGKQNEYRDILERSKHFLIKSAETEGRYQFWRGRWEVNYFWATTAVIEAFKDLNDPKLQPLIEGATHWLLSRQQKDGGWGEAAQSYIDLSWKGRATRSTASQSAWVLKALMRVLPEEDVRLKRGFDYLKESYARERWADPLMISAVLPGEIYMDFPVYSKTSALRVIRLRNSR